MKCAIELCTRDASHAPKVNVPAQGWPIEAHPPLGVLFGWTLCARCCDALKIADFLTDDVKRIVAIGARGLCPPDFDRAWITKVRLDSAEFLTFERADAQKGRPLQ